MIRQDLSAVAHQMIPRLVRVPARGLGTVTVFITGESPSHHPCARRRMSGIPVVVRGAAQVDDLGNAISVVVMSSIFVIT